MKTSTRGFRDEFVDNAEEKIILRLEREQHNMNT